MSESEVAKSHFGIRHPQSESILLHSDAQKLLQVSRGYRVLTCEDEAEASGFMTSLREEADFVHDDVFTEFRKVFHDVFQLQRLLRLDWIKKWDGWAYITSLLVASQDEEKKRVHVEDFVYRFVSLCQANCLYDDFPSDAERRKGLEEEGYAVGKATGQGCNSLIASVLQLLLSLEIINPPSADVTVPYWRHEVCELVRQHFCSVSDVSLHPRLRSEAGKVVDVADDVHSRAFLEHHKHARAIVYF